MLNVNCQKNLFRLLRQALGAMLLLAFAGNLTGCNSPDEDLAATNGSCAVSQDQRGSFMGRLSGFPVRIVADSQFSDKQKQSLVYAAEQWNLLGQKLMRRNLFEVLHTDLPAEIRGLDPRKCNQDFGAENFFYVVREKGGVTAQSLSSHWTALGLNNATPGVTFRCKSGAGHVERQIVYIYPELVDESQVASVFVHELGHAIGLDHSCDPENTARSDWRSCKGLLKTHPYRLAVMFPWLRVASSDTDSPEIKEVPRKNDQLRGQCVMDLP